MDRCTQLVLHPPRNVQPVQLIVQEMAESAVVLMIPASGSIEYSLELVCAGLGRPIENGIANSAVLQKAHDVYWQNELGLPLKMSTNFNFWPKTSLACPQKCQHKQEQRAIVHTVYHQSVVMSNLSEWWGAGVVICLERGADLHVCVSSCLTCATCSNSGAKTWQCPHHGA